MQLSPKTADCKLTEFDSDKEDSIKRKKHIDTMKGGLLKYSKRPKFEWTQSNEDVTLSMKVEGLKSEQLKHIDVQFADTDVTIKLPDGRNWIWNFSDEIFRENSRVKLKKQRLTLHMKKKKFHQWADLEAISAEVPASCMLDDLPISITDKQLIIKPVEESLEVAESSSIKETECPPGDDGQQVLDVRESKEMVESQKVEEEEEEKKEETTDPFIKEEEPIVELQHIKHDYIEKDNTFVVHMYVKNVNKDTVAVHFEENNFHVKFQTSSPQFLKLHQGTTEDTKFRWSINLRGATVAECCKYKVTSTLVELCLAKKDVVRWGDLEALKCQETSSSKTDWVPVNTVKTQSEVALDTTDSQRVVEEVTAHKEVEKTAAVPLSTQKPTCKVQPLNKHVEVGEQLVTPGFTGLDNLGNTCFMSGVLQCLINTREFRDFFLSGDFQQDLNTDNVLGSGGKLAVCFAVLMRVLWSAKYFSYPPSKLKNLVAQKASQFTGFAQHDSQEFMAFLLDGLHEDLNRIKKKPYTETVEDRGRPDEDVANEAWAVHKKRNDSFVVDLFQGQYKSKLLCPVCGKVSITFDPFLYLSLPLPKRKRLLPVTFVWRDPYRKPVRYMLRLSKEATVEALKEALQKKTLVLPENMRVFEAYKGRIHKRFDRGSSLSQVQANDIIIVCELLSEKIAGEPVYVVDVVQRTLMPNQFPSRCHTCRKLCPEGSKLKRCTKCFKVGYCDQHCQKNHWPLHKSQCKPTPEPVGTPFILSLPESRATFSKLCQMMEAYSRYSVDVFQPPVKSELPTKLSSQLSSSSLSNSSQSSGSLNSLDSQSSFSSSCTITAEQDQNLDDQDMPVSEVELKTSCLDDVPPPGSHVSGTDSGFVSEMSLIDSASGDTGTPPAGDTGRPETRHPATRDMTLDCGYQSMVDVNSGAGEMGRSVSVPGQLKMEKEFTSPVKQVLGIQSGDTERSTPMFFIKPVDHEGVGIIGTDGERLDDKGETALDLSNRLNLSMDWKNNDKFPAYVLVQSKEMEADNDSSMMTATQEESNHATIQQCLELFTEPEVLSPEEAWYCPSCKKHREATKQLSTWRLPHTLIIQLKRFSFRNFIWRDKIDKMVNFPTRGLDLSDYYVGSRPVNEPPPIYDLYGVVNHHGGILGGHYTSFVRCAGPNNSCINEVDWRLCDDSRVTPVSHEKNVVTRAAYLLFYRRREMFIPPLTKCVVTDQLDEDSSDIDQSEKFLDATEDPVVSERDVELVIDTSSAVGLDMPDLDVCHSGSTEAALNHSGVTAPRGTQAQQHEEEEEEEEEEEDLGYTDMDSVD